MDCVNGTASEITCSADPKCSEASKVIGFIEYYDEVEENYEMVPTCLKPCADNAISFSISDDYSVTLNCGCTSS